MSLNPTELRSRVTQSAELIAEAAQKQVEGMSQLMQTVLAENKELHGLLSKEQAARARMEMDLLNKNIEIERLDETICALITPRRVR